MSKRPLATLVALPLLLACSFILLTSCTTGAAPRAQVIHCSMAYRGSSSVPIEDEESVTFNDSSSTYQAIFKELTLHAAYSSGRDNQERALRLWVTENSAGRELFRQLYQLPQDAGPQNQFIGGHGFTGLNYAYHPTSGAELQFWCTAG